MKAKCNYINGGWRLLVPNNRFIAGGFYMHYWFSSWDEAIQAFDEYRRMGAIHLNIRTVFLGR